MVGKISQKLEKGEAHLACDIGDTLVDIGIPSCIWDKAPTSPDWGDHVKKQVENNGKLMQYQHPNNICKGGAARNQNRLHR